MWLISDPIIDKHNYTFAHTFSLFIKLYYFSFCSFCFHFRKGEMALISNSVNSVSLIVSQKHFLHTKKKNNSWLSFNYTTERKNSITVKSTSIKSEIDFGDPHWKQKFQEDFENRFSLPHLKDVFDTKPIPTTFSLQKRSSQNGYVNDDDRALLKVIKYSSPSSAGAECIDPDCSWVEQWVHRAGPRMQIYFEPEKVKAGIVTCGGLCPSLNDVIRQIVLTLEVYGVQKIFGIQYGYRGFFEESLPEIPLSRQVVQNINLNGGSLLGVSRGGANINEIVDSMQARGINMLFILGEDGTHAGANAIHNECRKRKPKVSVVGVPKTIDNDILLMDKTFGFDTAVEEAQRAINSAYIEASLSSGQIDVCLIPEVPFKLGGPFGVLRHLEHLIKTKGSAVVCVAEGAGQDLLEKSDARDASGNPILRDIGVHIQQQIRKHFKEIDVHADIKYIDPTYMIRACRANASDAILCTVLGQNAVHGAFAGYSGITVLICNSHYVYLPIPEVISSTRRVDPDSRMWHRCLTSTGQPDFL
ncbi:ATP-dependent 6-phosphofructokinase 5, chloroplastic-like isoform X2 [Papaver somniferum]|uniref:ATP-dependent 6-phosphofructokinase 5, chloroplastic-like isoform X2 n=1 Tax=Papaver somniferum TaxID=3469 RepID=UPI000E6FC245|nr:ATP-dependent 6-phosphofructokinase 5, chloroplastic-like isoform X2 [Papaver somniferum]